MSEFVTNIVKDIDKSDLELSKFSSIGAARLSKHVFEMRQLT